VKPVEQDGPESGGLRVEDVHERLRAAIISGELRPNERLIEADLAERMHVSRTPVRESIQRLVGDGLVTRHRRGWVVHEHSPEEIREIYEVRAGLESWATRLGTERATDEEIARIKSVHAEAAKLSAAKLRPRLVELNEKFHQAVLETCGNERLRELIRGSREYYFNTSLARTYGDSEILASIKSQQAIVDAMVKRDGDAAERAAREHVQEAVAVALAKLQ
jgi:DNA-binding GntR family transcriptional regulator